MLRKGLLNSPLRTVLRSNAQFQSKLDAAIQSAVKSGLDRPSAIYSHLAAKEIISRDEHQMAVVSKLDKIWFERASSFLIATACSGEKYF
jgi:hypothetical protein